MGDTFEYEVRKKLEEINVIVHGIKTSYKPDKGNIIMGDGGIDLIGEYRNITFVVQCKNYTKDKVQASHIRQFIGTLSDHPSVTLGIFVTTIGYTSSSLELAKNAKCDILTTNIDNLIKEFTSYVNNKTKRRSSDDDEIITIESAEFDKIEVEKEATLSLFGIKIKGEVCLNNVKFKNIKVKCSKLD